MCIRRSLFVFNAEPVAFPLHTHLARVNGRLPRLLSFALTLPHTMPPSTSSPSRSTSGGDSSSKSGGCRICGTTSSEHFVLTITRETQTCHPCMRKDVNVLPDGSMVRFCYGHRRMEDVKCFAGKQTRCIEALEKIKLKRKRAQEKAKIAELPAPTNLKVSKGKTLVKAELSAPPKRGKAQGKARGKARAEAVPPSLTWSKRITPDPDISKATSTGDGGENNAADFLAGWATQCPAPGADSALKTEHNLLPQAHSAQTLEVLHPLLNQDELIVFGDEEMQQLPGVAPLFLDNHCLPLQHTFSTSKLSLPEIMDSMAVSESGGSSKVHAELSTSLVQAMKHAWESVDSGEGSSGSAINDEIVSESANPSSFTPLEGVASQGERVSILEDGEPEPSANQWTEINPTTTMDYWKDTWLTRGSVVSHTFSLGVGVGNENDSRAHDVDVDDDGGADENKNRARRIARIAKKMAASGGVFDVTRATSGGQDPPVFISEGGLTVRVHRDGTTSPVRELDPEFRARSMNMCYVTCSSPATVRHVDVVVSGVPPGVSFEGRFHDSTLLGVEELARRQPSAVPAPNSLSGSGSGYGYGSGSAEEEPRYDVMLRVHLPKFSVGLARVEAVWSDGPCRNMNAGAGFPILLVPNENIAVELKSMLSGLTRSNAQTQFKVRGFLQRVGFTLYAGLVREDQTSVTQLGKLYVIARDLLHLPALCGLIAETLYRLDQALEQRDIDEMISSTMISEEEEDEDTQEADWEEEMMREHHGQGKRASGSPRTETGDSDFDAAPVGVGKCWQHDCTAGICGLPSDSHKLSDACDEQNLVRSDKISSENTDLVVKKGQGHTAMTGGRLHGGYITDVIEVFFHFMLTVRPGTTALCLFCGLKLSEDRHKLLFYFFSFALLDVMVTPLHVFHPLLKRPLGRGRAWGYLNQFFQMRQRPEHIAYNERMYKSGTFFVGTATLMLSSKELMSLILRVLVYEPYSCFHFALFGFWFGSRVKVYYDYPVPVDKQSHWMFYSFVLFPFCFYTFYYQYAMKYAHIYYGEQPMKQPTVFFVQQLLWCGSQAVGMVIGNHLGLRRKANKKVLNVVEAPRSSEEIVDPVEEQARRKKKSMMVKRLLHSALTDRMVSSRMHGKME